MRRTPVEESPGLSEKAGVPVSLKLECLQLTGSFKIRGAVFALARSRAEERRRGDRDLLGRKPRQGRRLRRARARDSRPRSTFRASVDESKYRAMVALGAASCARGSTASTRPSSSRRPRRRGPAGPTSPRSTTHAILAANGGTLAAEVLEDAPEARTLPRAGRRRGPRGRLRVLREERFCRTRGSSAASTRSRPRSPSRSSGARRSLRLPPVATTAGGLEGGIGQTGFEVLKSAHRRRRAVDRGGDLRAPCASCSTGTST